jgi:hypothetical protein
MGGSIFEGFRKGRTDFLTRCLADSPGCRDRPVGKKAIDNIMGGAPRRRSGVTGGRITKDSLTWESNSGGGHKHPPHRCGRRSMWDRMIIIVQKNRDKYPYYRMPGLIYAPASRVSCKQFIY